MEQFDIRVRINPKFEPSKEANEQLKTCMIERLKEHFGTQLFEFE